MQVGKRRKEARRDGGCGVAVEGEETGSEAFALGLGAAIPFSTEQRPPAPSPADIKLKMDREH